jgi:hypothetical protein
VREARQLFGIDGRTGGNSEKNLEYIQFLNASGLEGINKSTRGAAAQMAENWDEIQKQGQINSTLCHPIAVMAALRASRRHGSLCMAREKRGFRSGRVEGRSVGDGRGLRADRRGQARTGGVRGWIAWARGSFGTFR